MVSKSVKIDFQAFVNGLPMKYLQCRADGHGPWRAVGQVSWDNTGKVYDRQRRCTGCGTEKPQYLDGEGYIVKVSRGGYRYPEGYLATDVALPTLGEQKAAYRLALVRIQMAGAEPRSRRSTKAAAKKTAAAKATVKQAAESNVVPMKKTANGG